MRETKENKNTAGRLSLPIQGAKSSSISQVSDSANILYNFTKEELVQILLDFGNKLIKKSQDQEVLLYKEDMDLDTLLTKAARLDKLLGEFGIQVRITKHGKR